jgi:hypothetical protein
MALTLVPAFVATWFVKEEPLREHSPLEMRHRELEEPAVL